MSIPTKKEIAEWSEDRLSKMERIWSEEIVEEVLAGDFDAALETAKAIQLIWDEGNTR